MQSGSLVAIKKLGIALIILLLLSFVIMAYIRLIPGDPVKMLLGPTATDEAVAQMSSALNFDKPLVVQWFVWIKDIITEGQFGTSLTTHQDVSIDIITYLPRTLELILYGAILLLVLSISTGMLSALFKNTWLDNVIRIISYLGVVIPPYVWGILLMLIFSYILKLFPLGGMPKIPADAIRTGFPCLDALLVGNFKLYGELIRYMTLPVLSVIAGSTAYTSRMHRSSVISVSQADYISFARVSGVKERTIVLKHLMKPSFIPTLTIYGLQVSFMLTNLFLVENIFRYPGFSRYALSCIKNKDAYAIVGVSLIVGIILALVNTLVDIGVASLDPRIRLKISE